jgi:TusE/DsrC/DsvC family sulfur relay protein
MDKEKSIIEINGRKIALDEEGNLLDLNDWSEGVGRYLCELDGLQVSDVHWEVILFIRDYYKRYEAGPMPRIIVRELNKRSGFKKYTIKYLYELFSNTPINLLCKYAGVPHPSGCT